MKKSNRKLKENPIMGNQKNIKGKNLKSNIEEHNEVKTFIILLIIIAILIGAIYFMTEFLKSDDKSDSKKVVEGSINYGVASVGMILNRPYDEYYVLLYDKDDNDAALYSTILNKYTSKSEEEKIKIYYTDLGNDLNSKYYNVNTDNRSNPNAKTISEFDFGNITLIKIEKGNITTYIENLEQIKEILK